MGLGMIFFKIMDYVATLRALGAFLLDEVAQVLSQKINEGLNSERMSATYRAMPKKSPC
jgi:hypothetical protein